MTLWVVWSTSGHGILRPPPGRVPTLPYRNLFFGKATTTATTTKEFSKSGLRIENSSDLNPRNDIPIPHGRHTPSETILCARVPGQKRV